MISPGLCLHTWMNRASRWGVLCYPVLRGTLGRKEMRRQEKAWHLFLVGLLGLAQSRGDSGPQESCYGAWVTKCSEDRGGTGPLSM